MHRSLSKNIAAGELDLGEAYNHRADRAAAAGDLNRCTVNLELALPHFREAVRLYRAINLMDTANVILLNISQAVENIRQIRVASRATGAVIKVEYLSV